MIPVSCGFLNQAINEGHHAGKGQGGAVNQKADLGRREYEIHHQKGIGKSHAEKTNRTPEKQLVPGSLITSPQKQRAPDAGQRTQTINNGSHAYSFFRNLNASENIWIPSDSREYTASITLTRQTA
jgi:hypothetical protein